MHRRVSRTSLNDSIRFRRSLSIRMQSHSYTPSPSNASVPAQSGAGAYTSLVVLSNAWW